MQDSRNILSIKIAEAFIFLLITCTGIDAKSLEFDGVNDYIEIPPHSSLDITGEITFEAWIKWDEELGNAEFQIILNRDWIAYEFSIGEGPGNGNFLWSLGNVSTSTPDAYGGWRVGGPIPRKEWVHVALTYGEDRAKAYINGELVADFSANGSIRSQNSSPVRIGMRDLSVHPSYFHGCIDEVRLWSVSRTAEEIQHDMTYTLSGESPGLVAYWDFEQGEGQELIDLSMNQNHGRLGNSTGADVSDPIWKDDGAPVLPRIVEIGKPIVQIQPTHPGTLDDLFAVILNGEEIIGASTILNYDWFRDGELIQSGSESSFSADLTERGQTIDCLVLLSDGVSTGEAGYNSVVIRNTQPRPPIFHIVPETPMPNDPLAVIFDQPSVDPDGDPVVYVFEWFESDDGLNWIRRPEVSGTLPPPVYVSGEPEISGLYTQMGEYWRVEITAWDGILEAKRWNSGIALSNDAKQSFGPIRNQVRILPSFNGDPSIGPEDLLFVLEVWHKTKGELDRETSLKFFEETDSDQEEIGTNQLLKVGLEGWYFQQDKTLD